MGDRRRGNELRTAGFTIVPDETSPPLSSLPAERPWQFTLLHLFGLTTVVAVVAVSFYWTAVIGSTLSFGLFLAISTFYRSRAVVRTAAPSLRNRSLPALIGFAVVTSFVACFASLVAFCVTCVTVGMTAIA